MSRTGGAGPTVRAGAPARVGAKKPLLRRRRVRWTAGALVLGVFLVIGLRQSAEPEAVTLVEEMPGRSALLEARARAVSSENEEGPVSSAYPVRGEITESDAFVMFPTLRRGRDVFDPQVFFRRPPGLDFPVRAPEHPDRSWRVVTNSIGLTQDWELASERPDLRVLVIGDSQTSGVCPYPESIPGRLQARFASAYPDRKIEIVNGGKGAWTFHNYLGMLERMRSYEPDIVVVMSYAGNDYAEALLLHHYLSRTAPPRHSSGYRDRVRSSIRGTNGAVTHSLLQAYYLADHPQEEEVALGSVLAVTEEMLAVCAEDGIRPIFVNIPSPFGAQPNVYAESVRAVLELLDLEEAALAVTRRLSSAWVEFLEEREVDVVDLVDVLAAEGDPMYWFANHHLNSAANQVVAGLLFPVLEGTLD